MDYKKLIKNRDTRTTILRLFDFVPDDIMLRIQYRIKTGRGLNLKAPKRYTEKIQWYKLYYRDPLMAQCVDKFEVRHYVESCGMESILNECYVTMRLRDYHSGGDCSATLLKPMTAITLFAVAMKTKNYRSRYFSLLGKASALTYFSHIWVRDFIVNVVLNPYALWLIIHKGRVGGVYNVGGHNEKQNIEIV